MFKFRTDTIDSYIFYKIIHDNEYKLQDDLSDKIIVDIGAHIGSFSIAALQRNAAYVYAYEAHPENYELAKENISNVSSNFSIENLAVVGNNDENKVGYGDLSFNTGQHKITKNIIDDKFVNTIKFDHIIRKIISDNKKIDILKIDCEGSEYPIFYTSLCMYNINHIVGEYHDNLSQEEINKNSFFDYSGEGLIAFFKSIGMRTFHQHIQDAGLFFATRNLTEKVFKIDQNLLL